MPDWTRSSDQAPLNVAHVSVRLSEGGAAGVAKNLIDELSLLGVRSSFAYGYGPHGGASPDEARYNAVRLTSRLGAAANLVAHSLTGTELVRPTAGRRLEFRAVLEAANVIHLHIAHSYFVPPVWLLEELRAAGKPVVWTLHDQWIMTGRCAQPGGCRLWESGCVSCPNLNAYPPAKVDNAKRQWNIRRTEILALQASVPTALVACASWLAEETRVAGFRNVSVVTNSVDRAFWNAIRAGAPSESRRGHVFICRDLRDAAKVRWDVLEGIAQQSDQPLTIVGDNSDRNIDKSLTRPSITSRVDLATVMQSNRNLIFTSQVDYYPLTVAEALVAGMKVFALDSPAIREFQSHPRVVISASTAELVKSVVHSDRSLEQEDDFVPEEAMFDPSRMAKDYLSIYRDLIADA